MSVIGDILFYRNSHSLTAWLAQRAKNVSENAYRTYKSSEDLEGENIGRVATAYYIKPLRISERGEFDVAVSGSTATIKQTAKFEGERDLWRCEPSQRGSTYPRGELRRDHVTVGMSVPRDQPERAKRFIDDQINAMEEIIAWQAEEIEKFNNSIPTLIMQAYQRRQREIDDKEDILRKLKGVG